MAVCIVGGRAVGWRDWNVTAKFVASRRWWSLRTELLANALSCDVRVQKKKKKNAKKKKKKKKVW
jgi:hypothetical protein